MVCKHPSKRRIDLFGRSDADGSGFRLVKHCSPRKRVEIDCFQALRTLSGSGFIVYSESGFIYGVVVYQISSVPSRRVPACCGLGYAEHGVPVLIQHANVSKLPQDQIDKL